MKNPNTNSEMAMIEGKSTGSIYNGEYCRVHIRVRSETVMGQTVAVSGSTYQLGYFDREKVVQLVTSPESYPVWYTLNPIVLPKHQLVHYKFCIMEGGSMRAFENSAPRTFMPDVSDTVIEGTFNPTNLVGSGADSEMNLLAEISALTKKTNVDREESDKLLAKELAGKRMIIVCYHLPIVVKRTTGEPRSEHCVLLCLILLWHLVWNLLPAIIGEPSSS
jgi:Starch binding domain